MPKIYGELQDASLENLSSDPSSTVTGRVWNNTTTGQVKTDDGTNKRALLRNDQKAVIGNSGTADNNVRLHRGADETIQFVKGGDATAEGTLSDDLAIVSAKSETFAESGLPTIGNVGRIVYVNDVDTIYYDDGSTWKKVLAQSLATTKGDILARGSSEISRLAVGTNNQVLTADSSATLGVKWATVGTIATSSHSSAYTASIGDGLSLNDSSGAGYTIGLPSASGNNGEKLSFKKIDSSFNLVGIGTTALLSTEGEMVTIISDGTSWLVFDRYTPSNWAAVTMGVNGGFNSIITQQSYMKRVGDTAHFKVHLQVNVSAAAGSFGLPAGLTGDTSKFRDTSTPLGTWWALNTSAQFGPTARVGACYANIGTPQEIRFSRSGNGFAFEDVGAINSVIGSGQSWAADFQIAILNWEG